MAELVDALVSNTSGSNTVSVRSRLRVPKKGKAEVKVKTTFVFFLNSHIPPYSGVRIIVLNDEVINSKLVEGLFGNM